MASLINIIKGTYPLSQETFNKLMSLIETDTHPAKYEIEKIGKKPTHFYFLIKGIVRTYNIQLKTGKESNIYLYFKESYFSSFASLINNEPSNLSIECLTDCVIAKCNYKEFIKLTDICPDLNLAYIKTIQNSLVLNEEKEIEFATLTATERYLSVKNRIPNIDNLISQKHIASYLGITPVQLSRLKKKLYAK